MKSETLGIARCFCEEPGNLAFIFDENWKCAWKNCSYDGENFIQELLKIPENCWVTK
ncbi:MAG: hypothetical protein K2K06_02940 [Oscillospiraceae bacterium]|nr:hypothetical protein [Oscillospiraceae bacterium]